MIVQILLLLLDQYNSKEIQEHHNCVKHCFALYMMMVIVVQARPRGPWALGPGPWSQGPMVPMVPIGTMGPLSQWAHAHFSLVN